MKQKFVRNYVQMAWTKIHKRGTERLRSCVSHLSTINVMVLEKNQLCRY